MSTEPSLSHEQEDDTSVYVAPSPRVRHFFSNLPSTQRSLLRPCLAPDESLSPAQLLTPLRALWKRFRLDRFTDLTPRQHLFLTGTTTPAHLPDKERFSLFSRFGFGLMNRLVLDDHIDLVPLVQSLSQTHLPCSIRLNMWLLCLTGLDSSALRHELLEVRDWLAAAASGADPQDIEAVLVPPLRELAHNSDDSELAQLLDTSHAPGEVLAALNQWVHALQADTFDQEATSAPGATSHAPDSHVTLHDFPFDPIDRPSPIDAWVMKLRGVDADQLSQIRNRLTTVQSAATRLLGDAPNLTSTIEFTQLARELNSLATSWLTTWPGADELTKDRREAAQVYQEAYALLGPDVDGLLADASINPRELHTIVELTKRKDLLDRAPQWIWLLDDDSPTSDTTKPPNSLAHARALLRPEIRNRIQTLLHHLDELDEPTALQWLDGPPPGETVSDHIDHWYNQVRDFFRTAPVELVSVLKADRAPGASLHTLVQDVSRFPYLKESLQSSVADQILEHLRDVPGTQQRLVLAEFCDAVDHYRNKVGDRRLMLNLTMSKFYSATTG